jgi:hypothetical protein
MKTTSIDRNGNLSVNGTFNFEGSLIELRNIINKTIEEHGEKTKCRLATFGSFPHNWSSHIIIEKNNKDGKMGTNS